VTDETSHMVIDRTKRYFYQRYPNSNVMFSYRVGPLNPEHHSLSDTDAAGTRKKKSSDTKNKPHTIK
jgi:hypothetical protein